MIYLHIPYCHRKCTYCAFYSVVTRKEKQSYVDALCRELELRRQEVAHPVQTLYMGGGTPSLLSLAQLEQIAEALRNYDLSQLQEATLEANPEDLTADYLQGLRRLGLFNRLSVGVQSFHDADLRLLNRRHDARQAVLAVQEAARQGFDNVSLDLIYGLPGQTVEDWRDNLSRLRELPIQHLSAYALTVEEGTALGRQVASSRVVPASEEVVLAQYEWLLDWCAANGWEQYEVSNFSRPNRRALHNSRYWNRTPYMGVGAAAHSFDMRLEEGNACGHRRWNVADVAQYCTLLQTGQVPYEEESLTLRDAHNEYVMTALRTVEGIEKRLVSGTYARQLAEGMRPYITEGLIVETPTHYRPTRQGLLQADGLAAGLFEL